MRRPSSPLTTTLTLAGAVTLLIGCTASGNGTPPVSSGPQLTVVAPLGSGAPLPEAPPDAPAVSFTGLADREREATSKAAAAGADASAAGAGAAAGAGVAAAGSAAASAAGAASSSSPSGSWPASLARMTSLSRSTLTTSVVAAA